MATSGRIPNEIPLLDPEALFPPIHGAAPFEDQIELFFIRSVTMGSDGDSRGQDCEVDEVAGTGELPSVGDAGETDGAFTTVGDPWFQIEMPEIAAVEGFESCVVSSVHWAARSSYEKLTVVGTATLRRPNRFIMLPQRHQNTPFEANTATSREAGRCLLCGRGGAPEVWRETGFVGRACSCGILYLDPAPDPSLETYRAELLDDAHTASYYRLPAQLRLDWLRSVRPSGRLLEVGCGPGFFLEAARKAGYEVAGLDPNPKAVERVQRELGIQVEESLIETSELPEGSFDIVWHVDLLSHFPDPEAALRAMVRRLRTDGRLCFEVGAMVGISPRWYRWSGRLGFPEHRWFYSREAVSALLARAGLEVESTRRFGLLPSLLLIRLRVLLWPLMKHVVKRPTDASGQPPESRGAHRLYDRLLLFLRYRLGRLAPAFGPQTLLVAARKAPESVR